MSEILFSNTSGNSLFGPNFARIVTRWPPRRVWTPRSGRAAAKWCRLLLNAAPPPERQSNPVTAAAARSRRNLSTSQWNPREPAEPCVLQNDGVRLKRVSLSRYCALQACSKSAAEMCQLLKIRGSGVFFWTFSRRFVIGLVVVAPHVWLHGVGSR